MPCILIQLCNVNQQNSFFKLVFFNSILLVFYTYRTSYVHHLLLQSALQPLWVMAYSTVVEYSQQEGFYSVPLPAARQTPNLEDQWLERSNSRHQVSLTSETTRAKGRWNYGREIAENFAESGDFHVTFGFFTCRKFTTWDRRLYFPSEGRRAEEFFARKIRQLRPGLNPKASTLTSRPPKLRSSSGRPYCACSFIWYVFHAEITTKNYIKISERKMPSYLNIDKSLKYR